MSHIQRRGLLDASTTPAFATPALGPLERTTRTISGFPLGRLGDIITCALAQLTVELASACCGGKPRRHRLQRGCHYRSAGDAGWHR